MGAVRSVLLENITENAQGGGDNRVRRLCIPMKANRSKLGDLSWVATVLLAEARGPGLGRTTR